MDATNKGIKGLLRDKSGFEAAKGLGSGVVDVAAVEKTVRGFELFFESVRYKRFKAGVFSFEFPETE